MLSNVRFYSAACQTAILYLRFKISLHLLKKSYLQIDKKWVGGGLIKQMCFIENIIDAKITKKKKKKNKKMFYFTDIFGLNMAVYYKCGNFVYSVF